MRILYIAPYVPSRIRVRSFELLRHLAERGHEITLATLFETKQEREQLTQLVPLTKEIIARHLPRPRTLLNCARAATSGVPLQGRYCWQPELAEDIRKRFDARPFDVVHTEHLRGALFGVHLRSHAATTGQGCSFVWDSVDCLSELLRQTASRSCSLSWRLLARLELARTRREEVRLARRFNATILTTNAEVDAMTALLRDEDAPSEGLLPNLQVVPNGVDCSHFQVQRNAQGPPAVAFLGKMSYHANLSAALHLLRNLMPEVWSVRPDVRLDLVGKDPPKRLLRLARRLGSRVALTGTVDDVRDHLDRASVGVAPLTYGGGVQNKVLEFMATGTPVIASPTASSALTAEPGRAILVAESDSEFVSHILELLENPKRASQIGSAGREYVEQHHSWRESVRKLEGIYGSA